MSDEHAPAQLRWLAQRIANDFLWVCLHLLFITSKSNEVVPFELNRIQRWVWWNIQDMEQLGLPVRLWILKGRQFGLSTFMRAFCFWKSVWHGLNCLLLAQDEGKGKEMFVKDERFHRFLPTLKVNDRGHTIGSTQQHTFQWPQPVNREAQTLMRFDTSLIKRESAEIINAGVSETYQVLHLTELPLWRDTTATMGGLLPTVGYRPGTYIVGEFTARGAGDYTHGVWQNAVGGQSVWRPLFLPWYWHEEYVGTEPRTITPELRRYRDHVATYGYEYPLTEAGKLKRRFEPRPTLNDLQVGHRLTDEQLWWVKERLDEFRGDWDMFNREYPATPEMAFQTSGRRVIPPSTMERVDAKHREPVERGEWLTRVVRGRSVPRWTPREDGETWIFDPPQSGARYMLDADTSSGQGADYSAGHVLRISDRMIRVVASWRLKVSPHEYGVFLARMGRWYRDYMVLDANEVPVRGRVAEIVPERNGFGEHVIHTLVNDRAYRRIYRHKDNTRDNARRGHRYGFPTTPATKMAMLQNLAGALHDDLLEVPCQRTRSELRSLVYLDDLDKTAGAMAGSHDDLPMALGIGVLHAMSTPEFRFGFTHDVEEPYHAKPERVFERSGH